MAYLDAGRWPEGMDRELIKYYRRTYLSPRGEKHHLFLEWRQELEKANNITFLQRMWLTK